jgi:prepilin-type N-terminal cleavage/methylation domain-containing protein
MNRQGFTLIERMVVIVIIGVLASLAIPRFTEASSKAKAAEAPRVLSSYETAFLAAAAEVGEDKVDKKDLIFDQASVSKDSKWFNYDYKEFGSAPAVPCPDDDDGCTPKAAVKGVEGLDASSTSKLGKAEAGSSLCTQPASDGAFSRGGEEHLLKLVPNFRTEDGFTCE